MTNDAAAIDDERGALRDVLEPDHVRVDPPVLTNHVLVEVTEKRKLQQLGVGPCLQCKERVDRDAEHRRIDLVQFGRRVRKRAHLGGTSVAERRRHERQDHWPLLQLLAQRDRLSILVRKGEIWRLGADSYRHSLLLSRLTRMTQTLINSFALRASLSCALPPRPTLRRDSPEA